MRSSHSYPPGIGNIAIGYGTDLSGGCGNPGHCPKISDINSNSINLSTKGLGNFRVGFV